MYKKPFVTVFYLLFAKIFSYVSLHNTAQYFDSITYLIAEFMVLNSVITFFIIGNDKIFVGNSEFVNVNRNVIKNG